jgi:hypothetical protein
MKRRPAIRSAAPRHDGWPPVCFLYSERGKACQLDAARQAQVLEILATTAVTSDVHPWEFLACEFFLQGTKPPSLTHEDIYPPVARACREILAVRSDRLPQVSRRLMTAHNRMVTAYTDIVGSGRGVQLFLDDAAGRDIGDLPVERFLSHGRDRIMSALVDHLAQGETWAATVLARIGGGS